MKNIITLVMIAFSFIAFHDYAYAQRPGQEQSPTGLSKETYNISENDVEGYLDDLKTNDPTTYKYLTEMKSTNKERFNELTIAGVLKKRISGNSSPHPLNNELEDSKTVNNLKKLYNITNNDIESCLNKLYTQDKTRYEKIKTLMKEKPFQAEAILVQEIIYQRGRSNASNGTSPLNDFVLQNKIKELAEEYKSATTASEKESIKKELKESVTQSLDAYNMQLDTNIDKLKKSLEKLKEVKSDYAENRQQKIEERLNFYLNLPSK